MLAIIGCLVARAHHSHLFALVFASEAAIAVFGAVWTAK
jgi:hypothetical protein